MIRAMIVAGETLWAGGAKPGQGKAGEGQGVIVVMSTEDGSKLGEFAVAEPPAAEGMAAAYGRLYVATRGGRLLCLGKK